MRKSATRRSEQDATNRRVSRHRAKRREIGGNPSAPASVEFTRPDCSDPEAWLLAYLQRAYPLPFGQVHRDIIREFVHAIDTGGRVAIAAPRGTGKSTLVNGLALWALLTGRTLFPVIVPWADKAKRQALRFWSNELCFNARLHADYPEATAPFKACAGVAQRLAALTSGTEATGARLGLSEGVIVLPRDMGAIGSATINGNPRGINYSTQTGEVRRPTLAIVDDPQDRKTAHAPARVADTIDRLDADVAGMAGPDQRMAIVMCCTVIAENDVAEHYLKDPDWRSVRVAQIVAWPTGWGERGSLSRRLWDEWNDTRLEGEGEHDGGRAALEHYNRNKAAMTDGMVVSWSERYDRKRGQPDALYAAIYDYYAMGEEAFASERQNQPLNKEAALAPFTLTVELIQARATPRRPWERPPWATSIVASTDVNPSYALTTVVIGYGRDQTGAVLWYGTHPLMIGGDVPAPEAAKMLFAELVAHGRALAPQPCKPEAWAVDAGGAQFDAVQRFAGESARLCGLTAHAYTGRGAKNYKPYGKTVQVKREQCHGCVDVRDGRPIKWAVWNADYWREIAQRAWLGEVGSPGAMSIFAGNHVEFASQICSERLLGKGEIGGMMLWNWQALPGRHDYGDAMAQAYACAAMSQGIGTGALGPRRQRYVERRKARVIPE